MNKKSYKFTNSEIMPSQNHKCMIFETISCMIISINIEQYKLKFSDNSKSNDFYL